MKKTYTYCLILSLLFASCSYQKRLNKWCKKCPSVEIHDTTVIKHDSIVRHDSIFAVQLPALPADTIKVKADCPPSGEIDIAMRTYDYDYVSVDVWVKDNVINVKPRLKTGTINVLIRNAKIEYYRYLYEKYKNYKATTVIEKHIPGWIWLFVVLLVIANVLQYLYYKLYLKR